MKKMLGPVSRAANSATLLEERAFRQIDKISRGEVKAKSPLHPGDQKAFDEAQKNATIREMINRKYDQLIEWVGKVKITSTDPPETPKSDRELPKRPYEYANADVYANEYGFIEYNEEKIEQDRLMFREAMEILRSRAELEPRSRHEDPLFGENLFYRDDFLSDHPAVKRVNREKLETVWRYFRPFSLRQRQNLALNRDILKLSKYVESADGLEIPEGENFYTMPVPTTDYMREKIGRMQIELADRKKAQLQIFSATTDENHQIHVAKRETDEFERMEQLQREFFKDLLDAKPASSAIETNSEKKDDDHKR